MTRTLVQTGVFVLVAWLAGPAAAQEASDWTVFRDTGPVECFAASRPTSQETSRDGQPVEVSRGEIRLFVFYRPDEGVNGQVAFTGGYRFAPDSRVTLQVGGAEFMLFTDGEWAWPANPEEDARILQALRDGTEAVLTGQSERGTVTRDTFSLQGFAPSMDEAQRLCASRGT